MASQLQDRNFLVRFAAGVACPFRGLKLIFSDRRIFLLALAPFVVTLALYAGVLICALFLADNVADLLIEPGPWWRTALRWALMVGLWAALAIGMVFTYVFAAFTLAAPLYEFLSADVERTLKGEVGEEQFRWKHLVVDTCRAVTDTLKILIIEVFVLIFGFVLVPVSTVVCILVSSLLLALENLDYPMGRRRMMFRSRLGYLRRHFWTSLGFGLTLMAGLLIPFLGAAFLPMGVTGGTVMFCELERGQESNTPPTPPSEG